MKSEPSPSREFANFDRLVGDMLAVPKPEIRRIKEDERKAKPAKPEKRKNAKRAE
jgi:hypothetical protein